MIALVTGANGFIGRSLCRRLAARGDRVLGLVRDTDQASWMAQFPELRPVEGDVRDPSALDPEVEQVDTVFHLAGLTKALTRREYLEVNGEATGRLAGFVSSRTRARRFVYVSSLAVAGPRTAAAPAKEADAPRPITAYGESKLLGETRLREICSVPWTVVRPPVVYGPYDRDVLLYFKAAARGFVPLIRGGALQLSIAHVDDIVDALLLAAESDRAAGQTYYVSDGGVHTSGDFARQLLEVAGGGRILNAPDSLLKLAGLWGDFVSMVTRKPAVLNGSKVLESCQAGWVCSIDRIREHLGYAPRIHLATGLASTFRWYKQNGWI